MAGILILVLGGFGALAFITILTLSQHNQPQKRKKKSYRRSSTRATKNKKKQSKGGHKAAYFMLNG